MSLLLQVPPSLPGGSEALINIVFASQITHATSVCTAFDIIIQLTRSEEFADLVRAQDFISS